MEAGVIYGWYNSLTRVPSMSVITCPMHSPRKYHRVEQGLHDSTWSHFCVEGTITKQLRLVLKHGCHCLILVHKQYFKFIYTHVRCMPFILLGCILLPLVVICLYDQQITGRGLFPSCFPKEVIKYSMVIYQLMMYCL